MDTDTLERLKLKSLRSKAETLRSALDRARISIESLQQQATGEVAGGAPGEVQAEVLSQFSGLSQQYSFLMEVLNDQLKHFVAYPSTMVPAMDAKHIPLLLSSRLEPDMEAEQKALQSSHEKKAAGKNPKYQYGISHGQIEDHDAICNVIIAAVVEQTKEKGTGKGPLTRPRATVSDSLKTELAAIKPEHVSQEKINAMLGGVLHGIGFRNPTK